MAMQMGGHGMGHGPMGGGGGPHGPSDGGPLGAGGGGGYGQQPGGGGGGGGHGHPPPQQQQQPHQQPPQQPQQPPKELNAAMLCRFGQESVQEIAVRSVELFQLLKSTQPPDGKINIGVDRKTKFLETLRNIKTNFKRLRVIYDKIEESFPSKAEHNFEEDILHKSALVDLPVDDKRNTEAYRQSVEEYKEVMEHVMVKNRQLKDAIDQLRSMIWDINTMLFMRKE